jgi:hypothetical protein
VYDFLDGRNSSKRADVDNTTALDSLASDMRLSLDMLSDRSFVQTSTKQAPENVVNSVAHVDVKPTSTQLKPAENTARLLDQFFSQSNSRSTIADRKV